MWRCKSLPRRSSMNATERRRDVLAAVAVVAALVVTPHAQIPSRLDDAIRAIYERNEFSGESFGPARWLEDGRRYTTLTGGKPRDLVAVDTATGTSEVLVAATDLVPPGATSPLDINSYAWSADRTKMLVFTNTRRVWRQNTRGDYWLYDLKAKTLKKLGGTAPESTLMFAKLAPDATRVAFVRAQNIYVEDLASGRIVQVTTDGAGDIINGTSDWVNEEEFGLRDGFRWSPDGRHVAYWQFNTTGVERFTLINNTDALYPRVTVFPYPKPGTMNSAVRVGIVPATGGPTVWINAPGNPRDQYIPRMEWVDERTLALQHMNRLQNTNDFLLADTVSGNVRRAFRDQSNTWVDDVDPVVWLNDGKEFMWVTEKDGWRHAYAIAREGGRERLLTRFDGDVLGIDAVDVAGGRVYFTASPENATQRYLYMARLDGDGSITRVTPPTQAGSHSYDISPNGRWAIHTVSRFDVPPTIDIVSLPEHRVVRTLVDNAALTKRVAALVKPPVEFLKVDLGGGVVLDGYMLRPSTFDANRRYPVLVHVYGEPASTTVNDRWGGGGMLFHRAIAEEGYLVVSFDNRGTPSPKGAAWRKVVYGTVGELSAKEQAAAIQKLGAERPYIDLNRVAIWGSSGGGSNTLNAMFRYPDVYKVGMSIAPVPDQRLYDTIYQERYMGLPEPNKQGYFAGSPINFAEGLKGRLLIVHGTGDDNVHYQGTERLINRLVELGKPFDVMVYPNRTHSLSEGPGTRLHLQRLVARYLIEHLPPATVESTTRPSGAH
jgi:dipeptidyl-peptidase-4